MPKTMLLKTFSGTVPLNSNAQNDASENILGDCPLELYCFTTLNPSTFRVSLLKLTPTAKTGARPLKYGTQ